MPSRQEIFELAQALAPGPDDSQPPFRQHDLTTRRSRSTASQASMASTRRSVIFNSTPCRADRYAGLVTDLLSATNFKFASSGLGRTGGYSGDPGIPAGSGSACPSASFPSAPRSASRFSSKLASGFEAATQARSKNLPTFVPSAPGEQHRGTTPRPPTLQFRSA